MTPAFYMPKPAVSVVAEQITTFVDERDYVGSIELAHWILNALLEHDYLHAEWPENHDPFENDNPEVDRRAIGASSWVMPLNPVHTACLGAKGTGRVCRSPIGAQT